ncbi:hypothetical protein K470DRAFT_277888 [Piedraia hortae CBS 480.64]|uniref:NACHT domain-containing protein n=1 Tax=Piedraia hortae CBS 480.64 TaxID=1314780 RepID=A0A6A7BVE5_9PEZI|nr:hypothetical protein K470DRAFT_277888 [Piedraia hortae CBS 480.64]
MARKGGRFDAKSRFKQWQSAAGAGSKDPKNPRQLQEMVLDRLEDRERAVLQLKQNSNAIEDLITIGHNAKRLEEVAKLAKNGSGVMKRVERFLASLDRFKESGAAFASTKALPLGGVWGGIHMLIVLAVERESQRQSLVDALDTVMYTCCLLPIYHNWFCKLPRSNSTERLQHDLIDLFAQVYRISANAILAQSQNALEDFCSIVRNKHNLGGMKQRCVDLQQRVQNWMDLCDREKQGGWMEGLTCQIEQLDTELASAMSQVASMNSANLKLDLTNLKEAKKAIYDAQNSFCIPGTRVAILRDLARWIEHPSKRRRIFWLEGSAGTGKTTLARTVARNTDLERGFLVASFFFERGSGDLGKLSSLVPTIAKQLSSKLPSVGKAIARALREDSQTCEKHLEIQFERLLRKPLQNVSIDDSTTPLLFVIDSLDECDDSDNIKTVLFQLAKLVNISTINLRVIITSRPDHAKKFVFHVNNHVHKDLDKEQKPTIESDVRLVFQQTFKEIRRRDGLDDNWPGLAALELLVSNSQPLFIAAATACRLLRDGVPESQLESLLNVKYDISTYGLGTMYLQILKQAELYGRDAKGPTWVRSFQHIVKPLTVLRNTLSVEALSQLLGCPMLKTRQALNPLRSVIHVPKNDTGPINMFHLSFRDFLVKIDGEDQAKFGVDVLSMHGVLFVKCLELLEAGFQKRGMGDPNNVMEGGMCGSMCPGTAVSEIQVGEHISKAETYAAQYWMGHLMESGLYRNALQRANAFFQKHFLHWIETMCWLGKLDDPLGSVKNLRSVLDISSDTQPPTADVTNEDLKSFLSDAIRWVQYFRNIIVRAPFQIYMSALVFAPSKSIVKARFRHVIDKSLEVNSLIADDWSAELGTLRNDGEFKVVAVSPDGREVAASSRRATVIWDTETNIHKVLDQPPGEGDHLTYLDFLPNRERLLGVGMSRIFLWDTKSLSVETIFEREDKSPSSDMFSLNPSDNIWSLAISPNLQTIAVFDYDAVTWTLYNGEAVPRRFGPVGIKFQHCRYKFSPDSRVIAVSLEDESVRLWNAKTGTEEACFTGHSTPVKELSFTQNGRLLVSVSSDGTLCLWNLAKKLLERQLKFYSSDFWLFSFSSEGETVAGLHGNGNIHLLNLETGEVSYIPTPLDCRASRGLAVMPKGDKVVILYTDLVKVLDTKVALQARDSIANNRMTDIKIMPDGYTVAVTSERSSLQHWDSREGTIRTISLNTVEDLRQMTLSRDGRTLATKSANGIVQLWDTETGLSVSRSPKEFDLTCRFVFSKSQTGELRSVEPEEDPTQEVPFLISPDEKKALGALRFEPAALWDARSGRIVWKSSPLTISRPCGARFTYDTSTVNAFSSNGEIVATALSSDLSERCIFQVLDAKNGQVQSVLLGVFKVRGLSFSLSGKIQVSAYWPDMVWYWKADEAAPDFEPQWADGQPAKLEILPRPMQEDSLKPNRPRACYYRVHYPEQTVESLGYSSSSWRLDIDHKTRWIMFGNCKFMSMPPGNGKFETSIRGNTIAMTSNMNDLTLLRFTKKWLSKINELRVHCRCLNEICDSLRVYKFGPPHEDVSHIYYSEKYLELNEDRITVYDKGEDRDNTDQEEDEADGTGNTDEENWPQWCAHPSLSLSSYPVFI